MSKKTYGNPILLDTHGHNQIIDVYAAEAKRFRLNQPIINGPTFEEFERLEVKEIYKDYPGDELDLNSVGVLQELTIAGSPYETQGTSVAISETGTKIFAINDASSNTDYKGGIVINQSTSGGSFVYQNVYDYYTFTNDAYVDYNDINEDGTIAIFTDQALEGTQYASFYKYNGTSWVSGFPNSVSDVSRVKISGNYLAASATAGKFKIMLFNGTTYIDQQTIQNDGDGFITLFDIINESIVYYFSGLQIKKLVRSGTVWTQTALYATGVITSLAISGNLMVYSTATGINVYSSDVLIYSSGSLGITKVCTNGSIAIYYSSGSLKVISNASGTWLTQANETTVSGVTSLAINNNRLLVGRSGIGSYGSVQAYVIDNAYNGTDNVIINNIVLDDGVTEDLTATSFFGNVNVLANDSINLSSASSSITTIGALTLTGTSLVQNFTTSSNSSAMSFTNITDSSSSTTGALKLSGGLGLAKELYVGGRIHCLQGTTALPAYSFIGKTNMGMYSISTDTLSFGVSATNKFNIRATEINALQPFTQIRGTELAPAYTFSADQTTGLSTDATYGTFIASVGGTGVMSLLRAATFKTMVNLNRGITNTSSDSSGSVCAIGCNYPQTGIEFYQSGNTAHNAITFRTSSGFAGSIQCSGTSTAYLTTSDRKLKENFKKITVADKFKSLNVYEYQWKTNGKKSIGLIADELNEVFPDLVHLSSDPNVPDLVNYPAMVPYIIQKIKEQDLKIAELENIIKQLINGRGNSPV